MTQNHDNYLNNLRHSCAHLLAKAVKDLWPGTHNAIGPAIENGFYQDFDFSSKGRSASGRGSVKISESDLPKIEEKMKEILKGWEHFEYKEVSLEEAKKLFSENPYKLELAEEFAKGGKKLLTNNPGNFLDLCKMTHVENPKKEMQHFKLLKIAGAYWRGNEKNKMLTRIYGTVFSSQKELDEYIKLLADAERKDHRKIGKDLDLFVFSDLVGQGLPLFTPKGATIRRLLERFVQDEEIKRGYLHIITPPLAKVDLYKTSGHYPYYKDTMYPLMKVDEDELILRPMTCPHHFMLYKSRPRSYKELPIRFGELASQFRYEKSGELSGLLRVRMFCLADAHIFAQKEQAEQVIGEVLDLIEYANGVLGFKKGEDLRYRLSLGDRTDTKKYYKDDAAWDYAEDVLRKVLKHRADPYFETPNEAAFYGPKIDVQLKNAHGKEETAFTVQYDFVMPKRFELKYVDNNGKEIQPIVIHRSSIGAIERTMAFLIEKYEGAFPVWLAPVQLQVIPIAERHNEAAQKAASELQKAGMRVEVNYKNEPMGAKIRSATLQKVPYLGIIGDREITRNVIDRQELFMSVRTREGKDLGQMKLNAFIEIIKKEIEKIH